MEIDRTESMVRREKVNLFIEMLTAARMTGTLAGSSLNHSFQANINSNWICLTSNQVFHVRVLVHGSILISLLEFCIETTGFGYVSRTKNAFGRNARPDRL